MAIRLVIRQLTTDAYGFVYDGDTSNEIKALRNDVFILDSKVHIKSSNGASLLSFQNIDVTEIQLIAGGTFTFTDTDAFINKLTLIGFFDWINGSGSGGGTGVDRFENLLDTFDFFGNDGKVPVVDTAQMTLVPRVFHNVNKFTQLIDVPNTIQAGRMLVGNQARTGLEFQNIPVPINPTLTSVGYFDYADSATNVTPLDIVNGVDLKLTNDTLGGSTNISSPPYGVSLLWDSQNNSFDFSQLSIGDTVDIRVDIEATTITQNQHLQCYLKMGVGTASEYNLNIFDRQTKTSGAEQCVQLTQIYIGSNDIRNNPAELYLWSDANGTVKIKGWYCRVIRRGINVVNVTDFTKLSQFENDGNGTGSPFVTKQYVDWEDLLIKDRLDIVEANVGVTPLVQTSVIEILSTDITTTISDYVNFHGVTVGVNDIIYYLCTDSKEVYLFLRRNGIFGTINTPTTDDDFLKCTGGSTRIRSFTQIFTGGLQEFTLPTFAQIIQVSINGWSTEDYTKPNDTTVIINPTISIGQQVVILYLVDENTNIAPYYTQAQVDALIAGVSTGSVTEGEYTNTELNLTGTFNISTVTFQKCYWTQYESKKILNLSLNFTPNAVGNCNITLNLPSLINESGTAELLGTGSIFSSLNSGSATVQKDSLTTGRIFFKALDVNTYTLYAIITYKTN